MKNIYKTIIILLIHTLLIYSVYSFISTGKNSDAGLIDNDIWKYEYNISAEESSSSDYINNNIRGLLFGSIDSKLFGTFTADIILKLGTKTDCGVGEYTYSLVKKNNIISDYFGDMDIKDESYFCPSSSNLNLILNSSSLGDKIVSEVILVTLTTSNIFNKQEISINGISYIKGELANLDGGTDSGIDIISVNNNLKTSAMLQVKKNIANITRNLQTLTNNKISVITNNLDNDKYYYYNFEGEQLLSSDEIKYGSPVIPYTNKGKYLEINKSIFSSLTPDNYNIGVKGKNTIIVKGGNIYINADIYNIDDKNDILVLVAQKDSLGNGGNIYINPNVTNIDAIIIADGSLLNYHDNYGGIKTILDKTNHPNALYKQLLIYGSINTNNTIGSDLIPYGADLYNGGNNNMVNSIYDLINLRNFQLTYASDDFSQTCGGNNTLWNPINDSIVKTYAWAGKSKCFNNLINPLSGPEGNVLIKLKQTDKYNSLVIEYNTNIQSLSPYILTNN